MVRDATREQKLRLHWGKLEQNTIFIQYIQYIQCNTILYCFLHIRWTYRVVLPQVTSLSTPPPMNVKQQSKCCGEDFHGVVCLICTKVLEIKFNAGTGAAWRSPPNHTALLPLQVHNNPFNNSCLLCIWENQTLPDVECSPAASTPSMTPPPHTHTSNAEAWIITAHSAVMSPPFVGSQTLPLDPHILFMHLLQKQGGFPCFTPFPIAKDRACKTGATDVRSSAAPHAGLCEFCNGGQNLFRQLGVGGGGVIQEKLDIFK